nr:hypothetical protein [Tanacetum cinerariifolium]GEX36945.1 hypothetical protein [Tanacetum cinerariifolium]
MVTIDGEGVDWTSHAEDDTKNYALMAFISSNSGTNTDVTTCSKLCEESYAKLKKLYDEQSEQLGVASIEIQAYTLALKKVESKPNVVSEPKVCSYAPIIKEYESDSDDEYMFKASVEQEKPSCAFINTVKHVKTPRQTVKDQDTCSQNPKVPKRDWTDVPLIGSTALNIKVIVTLTVASLCISSGNLSSLAVGSFPGSGNSSLPVGMPCAFYSQQSSPKLDAPTAIKFPELNVYLERIPSITLLSWTIGNLVYLHN